MGFKFPSQATFATGIEPGETVAGWMLFAIEETAQRALSLTFEKRNPGALTATHVTFQVDYSATTEIVANILRENSASELTQAS